MKAIVVNHLLLGEVFSTFSIAKLAGWGIPEFETTLVQILFLQRVFLMCKEYTQYLPRQILNFRSPNGDIASVITGHIDIRPADTFKITYTITALPDNGPKSILIKRPNGKILRVMLYATIS